MLARLLVGALIVCTGCMHRIEVNPLPSSPATTTISRSLQIVVDAPALEGADHRPGITLLQWPQQGLRQAIIQYAEHRGTFRSASTDQADLMLHITAKLALASRQGRYHYHIKLQSEIRETGRLVKTYLAEATSAGSLARWVTASDRDPIESALQSALDDLFAKIEGDGSLYTADKAESPVP